MILFMKKIFIFIVFCSICILNAADHAPLNIHPRMELLDYSCEKNIYSDKTIWYCFPKIKYSDMPSFYQFIEDDFGITISTYYSNHPNKEWYYYISNDDIIAEFNYKRYDNNNWLDSWYKGKVNKERAARERISITTYLKTHTFAEKYY